MARGLGDPANAGQRDRQQVVKQPDMPSLSEAICRPVELRLTVKTKEPAVG
jgi:hypothetical protein